jgi:hypothetical protein
MKYFFAITLLLLTAGCVHTAPVSVVVNSPVVSNVNTAENVEVAEEVVTATTAPPVDLEVTTTVRVDPPQENDDSVEEADPETEPVEEQKQATDVVEEENLVTEVEEKRQIEIPLQVVSPNGVEQYTVTIEAGGTVEDAMRAAKSQGLSYNAKGYTGIGAYVKTINGLDEDRRGGFYWIYYLNGSRATAGITIQTLKKGDTLKWLFEKEF